MQALTQAHIAGELLYGMMPLFAESHKQKLRPGLPVEPGPNGASRVVWLGSARRESRYLPIVDLTPVDDAVTAAAIGRMPDSHSDDSNLILCRSDKTAAGMFAYKWSGKGRDHVSPLCGQPECLLTDSTGKHSFWILRDGDALRISRKVENDATKLFHRKVLFNRAGQAESISYEEWQCLHPNPQAESFNPQPTDKGAWAAANSTVETDLGFNAGVSTSEDDPLEPTTPVRVPFSQTPPDWVGQIVRVLPNQGPEHATGTGGRADYPTGELLAAGEEGLTLNLAFHTGDIDVLHLHRGASVEKIADFRAVRLSEQEALTRQLAKAAAKDLRQELLAINNSPLKENLPPIWCERLQQMLALTQGSFAQIATANLLSWGLAAKVLLNDLYQYHKLASPSFFNTRRLDLKGYFLVQKEQIKAGVWVVQADGSFRPPDLATRDIKHNEASGVKSGQVVWHLLKPTDVALVRSPKHGVPSHGNRDYVPYRPQGNLSPAQLTTIAWLEAKFKKPKVFLHCFDKTHAELIEQAARDAITPCPACGQNHKLEKRFHDLVSSEGATICQWHRAKLALVSEKICAYESLAKGALDAAPNREYDLLTNEENEKTSLFAVVDLPNAPQHEAHLLVSTKGSVHNLVIRVVLSAQGDRFNGEPNF
jgi:hypothetical protein